MLVTSLVTLAALLMGAVAQMLHAQAPPAVDQYGMFEASFPAAGTYQNPYADLYADAELQRPDATTIATPLFWDGENKWTLRISPNIAGTWTFTVRSEDAGLKGKSGRFECRPAQRRGSIRPMQDAPRHFQYQNGERLWFMGDTAWALFTDNESEQHDRAAAQRYLDARAASGFNVVHSMLLSEAGWANRGGPPFHDISAEGINPGYWREVDHRIAYANSKGVVCGLALAWGDKRRQEPFAWRKFPSLEARQRYARYIAARYGAFDVYFLVAGEWHGEIKTRPAPEESVRQEFMRIGEALQAAGAHGRMIGIHPMSSEGSVREFNDAPWMAFGDYQQNYRDLHRRILQSRGFPKPVVNSEYGYHLRDQNGDGVPDKENSTSLDVIRHSTWDIVMAGGYVVTGFGTTYFGGHRDPGPFDVEAEKNKAWAEQIRWIQRFFTALEWWKLEPHDELLRSATARGDDTQHRGRGAPPATAYWCLAEPGRRYVVYARGLTEPLQLTLPAGARVSEAKLWNPRTGEFAEVDLTQAAGGAQVRLPNESDWVVLVKISS